MDKIKDQIVEKDIFYIKEPDSEKRKQIHIYIKENYGSTHISRTEYMAHGAEIQCCGIWYKSSKYGESWNGGDIYCNLCGNMTFADFDDFEGYSPGEVKLSLYKPTQTVMIVKKGVPYKKGYNQPFSYRKRY
jgi:hypothetical protein